jgi:hypothetical protein
LSNIYGPSASAAKLPFITLWLNLDTSSFENWILAGDFNLYRNQENRSKPGGDLGEMQMFNNTINDLDLLEIPFN